MKPNATFEERFEGWFVRPIEKLKELPEGDGGFLALSAALFLCERYYRTVTKTHEGSRDDKSFKKEAAADLGVPESDFVLFWKVYRHGVQHQGMPRRCVENGVTYRAHMHESFGAVPRVDKIDARTSEIRLDPWKFADLIIKKFRDNPSVLKDATLHAFAEVI